MFFVVLFQLISQQTYNREDAKHISRSQKVIVEISKMFNKNVLPAEEDLLK